LSKPYGLMADVHLHNWSAFATTNADGVNSRLAALLDEIRRCAEAVAAAGGDTVVIAGDLFHVRGSVQPTVLNALMATLSRCFASFATNFIILAGNHDLEGKEAKRLSSAITALECPYVEVVNESKVVDLGSAGQTFMVPWIEDMAKLRQELQTAATSVTDAGELDLIIHAPIDGVIEGLPAHGLTPAWLDELGFKRVFSGHYHNHRSFCENNVVSIGALAHHSWSDVGTRAGFLIVYPEEWSWQSSHLPEFIDLQELAVLDPEDVGLTVAGNFIRARIESDSIKDVAEIREELTNMGARAVVVQTMPKAPVREGVVSASVASGASLETSVADFVRGLMGVDVDAVEKAAIAVLASVE
jgi:DNA repair exonuclease SbcCD nuclease subunit